MSKATFVKGDRVKRTNEWLWAKTTKGGQPRKQCLGTVYYNANNDHSVTVLWDGRKAPDQWSQAHVEKVRQPL